MQLATFVRSYPSAFLRVLPRPGTPVEGVAARISFAAAGIAAGVILGQIPAVSTTPIRALATIALLAVIFGSVFHVFAKLLDGPARYGKTLLAVLESLSAIFLLCSALALAGRLLSLAIPAISGDVVNVVFYYPLAAYVLAVYAAFAVSNTHQLTFPRAAVFLVFALGLSGYGLFWLTTHLLPWGVKIESATAAKFARLPIEEHASPFTLPADSSQFTTGDGVPISYGVYPRLNNHATQENRIVVISSGRTENRGLYAETIDALRRGGYTVYIHDHRGQGFSGRMLSDRQRSHVGSFDDYVADLETFITRIGHDFKGEEKPKLYLLAHSMGGAVASLYLEKNDNVFKAAALVTPMNGAKIPLKTVLCPLNKLVPDEALGYYALTRGGFDNGIPFEEDDLTHSLVRHDSKSALYANDQKLAVGGITHGWFRAACDAGPRTIANAGKIKSPVLLFQASHDTAVDNEAQEEFAKNANGKVQLIVVPQAYHAILMEHDIYRRPVMEKILEFFDKQPTS
jgi:lysophospholipase